MCTINIFSANKTGKSLVIPWSYMYNSSMVIRMFYKYCTCICISISNSLYTNMYNKLKGRYHTPKACNIANGKLDFLWGGRQTCGGCLVIRYGMYTRYTIDPQTKKGQHSTNLVTNVHTRCLLRLVKSIHTHVQNDIHTCTHTNIPI